MDGIIIPIFGVLMSGLFGFFCLVVPRYRRFLLSALTAPFITSVVFLLGGFVLADMNPAREYGAAYIPTGTEHDPNRLDYGLWILVVLAEFVATSAAAYVAQLLGITMLQNALVDHPIGNWLSKRGWFSLVSQSENDYG